jgi:hypothetical protein
MLAHAEEPTDSDDRVGYRSVERDDEIVDNADFLFVVIVNRFAQDLLLGAPSDCYDFHFFRDNAERAGTRHLRFEFLKPTILLLLLGLHVVYWAGGLVLVEPDNRAIDKITPNRSCSDRKTH